MIEEIKKEIQQRTITLDGYQRSSLFISEVFEILDKHNTQQSLVTLIDFENVSNKLIDYTSSWEELKQENHSHIVKILIHELEQKYKLGGK